MMLKIVPACECFLRRRTFLVFEGVTSAFYCWLNGERVGFSQDSCLPAEFDVARLLRPGENVLAVQVRAGWGLGI